MKEKRHATDSQIEINHFNKFSQRKQPLVVSVCAIIIDLL